MNAPFDPAAVASRPSSPADAVLAAFPRRPLTLSPPSGRRGRIGAGLISLAFAGLLGFLISLALPDLLADRATAAAADAGAARPSAFATLERGRCSTRMGLLHSCDLTLRVTRKDGEAATREVTYFLVGEQPPNTVTVLVDPARPGQPTTDLGLERLGNRTAVLGVMAAIALGLLTVPLFLLRAGVRHGRLVASLSGKALTPVALGWGGSAEGQWTLTGPDGATARFAAGKKEVPFALPPGGATVLGVTAPGVAGAVPLDEGLTWADFTDEERRALYAARDRAAGLPARGDGGGIGAAPTGEAPSKPG